ncbi:unnamed protein product [Lampetra fluviatilis]
MKSISPTALNHLRDLQRLELDSNQLESLPEAAFQQLVKLKELSELSQGSRKERGGVWDWHRLELDSNQLESLPEAAFQQLVNLKELSELSQGSRKERGGVWDWHFKTKMSSWPKTSMPIHLANSVSHMPDPAADAQDTRDLNDPGNLKDPRDLP